MFTDITAKLEDLHAIAVEGQQRDNAPDMQSALHINLRSGPAALDCTIHAIAKAVEGSRS